MILMKDLPMMTKKILTSLISIFLFSGCATFFVDENTQVPASVMIKKEKKTLDDKKKNVVTIDVCAHNKSFVETKYLNKYKTLCVGKKSLNSMAIKSRTQDLSILNAVSKTTLYEADLNGCNTLTVTSTKGNIHDNTVSFEHTYKEQLFRYYKNKCSLYALNNTHFIECQNTKKRDYFIEVAKIRNQTVFEKHMIQTTQQCFELLKKQRPSKILKKKHLNKFTPLYLASKSKNKMYNRSFYTDILFKKQNEMLYLVGKKIYGKKDEPSKIEEYYFYSTNKNSGAKELMLNENLVFDHKSVRIFDKNGLDQNGFDKFDWNVKLKKFRTQLK